MTEAEIADLFVAARKVGRGFPDFPGEVPVTLERAYAIQAAIIAAWPDDVAGWKVGRIVGGLADTLGCDRFIGPIFRQSIAHPHRHAELVSASTVQQVLSAQVEEWMLKQVQHDGGIEFPAIPDGSAVFEAELIIVTSDDAAAGKTDWTPDEAAALVGAVHIGVEAAGSPLATMPELGPLVSIAAFGANNGLIVGPEITDWQSHVPGDVSCTTTIDGTAIASAGAAAVPGGPLAAFAFALGETARQGRPIRRGDHISTGAITGMHSVKIGQWCTADFGRWGRMDCTIAPGKGVTA